MACDHRHAQSLAGQRRHVASARPRISPETRATIEARLYEDWSPEQIADAGEVAISADAFTNTLLPTAKMAVPCSGTCTNASDEGVIAAARRVKASALASGASMKARPSSNSAVVGDWARAPRQRPRARGHPGRSHERLVRLRKVLDGSAPAVAEGCPRHPVSRTSTHPLIWGNGSEFASIAVGLDATQPAL